MNRTEMRSPSPEDIRDTRRRFGLTQASSAETLGVSLRVWQYWEAGQRKMHHTKWALYILLNEKGRKRPGKTRAA